MTYLTLFHFAKWTGNDLVIIYSKLNCNEVAQDARRQGAGCRV